MRRIAVQIPDSVGRLIKSGHITSPPTWYSPILANPPPQISPLRQKIRNRITPQGTPAKTLSATFQPRSGMKASKMRVQEIKYREDDVRRRFFTDFPFEAMRPISMVELRNVQEESEVQGAEWTSLAQRGRYPTVEDLIEYTLKLHDEGTSLTNAYNQATEEFVALRAKHEMTTMAAEIEARHWGARFDRTPFERSFHKERKYLDAHLANQNRKLDGQATRVRWKKPSERKWTSFVHETALPENKFAGGWNYVDKWRRPAVVSDGEPIEEVDEFVSGSATTNELQGLTADTTGAVQMETEAVTPAEEVDDLDFLNKALQQKEDK